MNTAVWTDTGEGRDSGHQAQAVGVGLWVFIGVATTLFSLFLLANLMRMTAADWWPLTLPWQLWLSSALLVAGSVGMQWSAGAARAGRLAAARQWLVAGGTSAMAFLVVQMWAWSALQSVGVLPSGNPAGSFFYLLTAMHGLHVAGGLVAWLITAQAVARATESESVAWRIVLCARYWHFLLLVWLALYASIGLLTPDIARFICAPLRII